MVADAPRELPGRLVRMARTTLLACPGLQGLERVANDRVRRVPGRCSRGERIGVVRERPQSRRLGGLSRRRPLLRAAGRRQTASPRTRRVRAETAESPRAPVLAISRASSRPVRESPRTATTSAARRVPDRGAATGIRTRSAVAADSPGASGASSGSRATAAFPARSVSLFARSVSLPARAAALSPKAVALVAGDRQVCRPLRLWRLSLLLVPGFLPFLRVVLVPAVFPARSARPGRIRPGRTGSRWAGIDRTCPSDRPATCPCPPVRLPPGSVGRSRTSAAGAVRTYPASDLPCSDAPCSPDFPARSSSTSPSANDCESGALASAPSFPKA